VGLGFEFLKHLSMPAIKSLQPKPLSAEIWNTWPLYLIALIILVLTSARSSADNKSILLIAKSRGLSANSYVWVNKSIERWIKDG
jgi:hypothetical protein